MLPETCLVCGSGLELLYESPRAISFTSAQLPVEASLRVASCRACGHVQTQPVPTIESYYDTAYNFHVASADEDDLYVSEHGRNIYRSEHQARVVEQRTDLSRPLRVLDFGCGKARTLRRLTQEHSAIIPHVFDVSATYAPFWDGFVAKERQASYQVPD